VELQLGPLGQDQVAALVQRLVSVPPGPQLQGLLGRAGGNPLYVRELVDALSMERHIRVGGGVVELVERGMAPPVSLAAAIGARLSFLSETATRVLRAAAVLGVQFRADHLSLVTGRAPTALTEVIEEATVAGVLAESGTGLVFRHALIHQALYESIPGALRQALHHEVAEALAGAAAPAEAVAEQLLAAPQAGGDWVVDWLAGAAATLSVRAPQVALDLLQRVRETVDAADPRRALLDVALIDTRFRLGRYDDVETLARAVLAHTSDPEIVGRVTWARSRAHGVQGQFEQALAVTGQALTERAMTDRWRARLRARHALNLSHLGRFDEALRAAEQAETDGELAGDPVAVAWALYTSTAVHIRHHEDNAAALTRLERAAAVLGDAAVPGDEAGATDLRLMLLRDRAMVLRNLGRQAEAVPVMGQAVTLAERAGTASVLAALRVASAECCFYVGRWDDAMVELEAAAPDLPPGYPLRMLLRGFAACIAVHRDDQTTMSTHLRGAEDVAIPTSHIGGADHLFVARALAAERDGQPEQALALLLEVLDPESTRLFPHLSYDPDKRLWLIDAVRLAIAVGDRAVAQAATEACSTQAKRVALPVTLAAAHHCRGLLQADPTLLLSAADALDRVGYPLFRGHALENAAVLLAQRGDPAAARAAFTQAWQIYTDLDASWDIRRAEARLRPLGIRRGTRGPQRHRPTTGWEALTPTESKIAYLVAAGKSNPDIAAELYLSRNTVQTHVAHILTKLECRSRIDIAIQAMNKR
jgi:DNA-binding CsgD family transcriptional regulator